MPQVTGQVNEIKVRNTKIGDMYDLIVNGQSYGHGKYAPRGIKQGDFVTFEYEVKVNGQYENRNIVSKSLRVETSPTPEVKQQAVVQTSMAAAAADAKQQVISRQAALNTANALLANQLAAGGLKFPATAKPAAVFEAVTVAHLELASRLYKAATGDTWDVGSSSSAKPAVSQSRAPFSDGEDAGADEYPDA